MARTIAYEVEVRGIRGVIENQNDLTAAVKATTKAYKSADFGTDDYAQAEQELAALRTLQAKFRQDVRDTAREQTIAADKGKGSYRALNAELVNLRREFKELSAAEREIAGPGILRRIQNLDAELKDIDASIGQYQRNVGNYRDAFAELGGIDLASLATGPGAILAIGTAAIQAGAEVLRMTEEVRKLRGSVQTLTDATGPELDSFTSRIIGISETFGASTDEITNAANAVSKQLGISFEDALSRIEEGFIAGSNQTDEFLSNLLEYPAQFKSVFGEGEQAADALFNTLNQQATQGIFSDKAVDTIKEVGLTLRELPKTARDAINGLGLDDQQIERQIAENGIGAAIQTITARMGELRSDAPEVGTALADIFKGAGEDAGLDFVLSLQNIDAATGSLIDRTNEYQLQQERTLAVNQEFADAQVEVANALGGAGNSIDNVFTQLQTFALQLLVPVIGYFQDWFAAVRPVGAALLRLGKAVGLVGEETDGAGAFIQLFTGTLQLLIKPTELAAAALNFVVDRVTDFVGAIKGALRFVGILGDEIEDTPGFGGGGAGGSFDNLTDSVDGLGKASERTGKQQKAAGDDIDATTRKINSQALATKRAAVAADEYAKGSLADLRSQLSDLRKDLDKAAPGNDASILEDIIGVEQAIEKIEQGRAEIRTQISRLNDDIRPIELLTPIDETITQVQQSQQAIAEQQQEFDDRMTARAVANEKARNEKIKAQALSDAEERAAAVAEVQNTIFGAIDEVINLRSNASSVRAQNEINDLEDRYEREIELAEGNEERQAELEQELADERARIEAEEFERQKRFRVAAALASAAAGVVNILATPSTVPEPFTAPFKAARLAFLAGSTIAQIATIQSQQAARGISVDSTGRVRGELHSGPNAGVDVVLNGKPYKVEDGEIIDRDETGAVNVINRRSSQIFGRQLRAIRGKMFPGKRAYMSAVNSYRGFGVKFARFGATARPADASVAPIGAAAAPSVTIVRVDEQSVSQIANQTAAAVQVGAAAGVADGMDRATRNNRRQERLNQRTTAA